jgi:hypothetical protein
LTTEEVIKIVAPPANPRLDHGRTLYEFVVANNLSVGLEIGFCPGIPTVYLAGAIDALGAGMLTSVFQKDHSREGYDVRGALMRTGLDRLVTVYEGPGSYSWRLMTMLREGHFEQYDFCMISGGHTWSEVGFACCLAERMLKPRGWMLLDNIDFSFRESRLKNRKWVRIKQEDEQTTCQVQRVSELLLRQNPLFGTFLRRGSLALAQKRSSIWSPELLSKNRREVILYDAIERARHDPEFRDQLVNAPQCALSSSPQDMIEGLDTVSFIDTNAALPRIEYEKANSIIVCLDKPRWENSASENDLETMLKEAQAKGNR